MERHSLEWIISARTKAESEKRYDEWASTYDEDLTGDWDYKLPAFIGDLFARYVSDRHAKVLDAGVGTGLGGEYVAGKGYQDLFGIDMSPGMLKEAERKGIYRGLERAILGEPLGYADGHFDAVLSVGTIGTAPPESFDELIRVVKSGGYIVFSLRKDWYDERGFREKQRSLSDAGKWELVEQSDPMLGLPGESTDTYYYGFVFKKP